MIALAALKVIGCTVAWASAALPARGAPGSCWRMTCPNATRGLVGRWRTRPARRYIYLGLFRWTGSFAQLPRPDWAPLRERPQYQRQDRDRRSSTSAAPAFQPI